MCLHAFRRPTLANKATRSRLSHHLPEIQSPVCLRSKRKSRRAIRKYLWRAGETHQDRPDDQVGASAHQAGEFLKQRSEQNRIDEFDSPMKLVQRRAYTYDQLEGKEGGVFIAFEMR